MADCPRGDDFADPTLRLVAADPRRKNLPGIVKQPTMHCVISGRHKVFRCR